MIALRGNCPFVVKAHYAQLAGAKMLIVVDTEYDAVESHLMVDFMGQGFFLALYFDINFLR